MFKLAVMNWQGTVRFCSPQAIFCTLMVFICCIGCANCGYKLNWVSFKLGAVKKCSAPSGVAFSNHEVIIGGNRLLQVGNKFVISEYKCNKGFH